ncbi:hypothetical protein CLOLEP_00340 [[Clostridium] leptum DSM 753]|uniref:Uncharacterized protein n=1 Tax=[Clostridium] leptum DSM 753 TaxID=428125 RepID=A7VP64_9FIRM|nr:hypothetical protein CLOLEP_00340 [[Clostridium] leptum DSM 753]
MSFFLCPNRLLSKKSHYPPTGYSGYIDELTNHTYTFDNSFAPVCNLQTGAFCILSKNFFKKFLKPTSILKCVGLRVYERGHFKLHRFRGSERR